MTDFANAFLLVYAGLFPIINPVGNAPIFLGLTSSCTEAERNALARRVAINSILLLTGSMFIGSHLLETLLRHDQHVAGLDNFSTGSPRNLDDARKHVSDAQWARFTFREGSIADIGACREASNDADFVLHQAGFVSVPLSLEDPIACHNTNGITTIAAKKCHRQMRA